jgi:glutathione-independent formaldehyde dehydrogenase
VRRTCNLREPSLDAGGNLKAFLRMDGALVLGHEITDEVVEVGPGVEFILARQHRHRYQEETGICLHVNPDRPGSAYGYVDMGGWVGGQAEYVMVP